MKVKRESLQKKIIRPLSKERLQRQWKARERGFLKIFFQMYSQVNLENTYQLPFLCTTETKLRVFEFKFLHRRIATNDFLLKIGKNWGNTLVFLLRWFPRGNTHLFWNFKSTQTFWNNVSQWTCENLDLTNILLTPTPLPPHR